MESPKDFKNKVVVITGGAGGIGQAVSAGFGFLGARIIILGKSRGNFKILQKNLGKKIKLEFYAVEVSKERQVWEAVKKIIAKHHKIDVLINAAGILGPVGQFHTNPLKDWSRVISVNLIGTANVCHAVLPYMVKQKQGKIINFSGGGSVNPFPNFSGYAVSKAAIVRFTENLAAEYRASNIQVNAVAPGAVNTKFLKNTLAAGKKQAGESYYTKALAQKQNGGDSPLLAAGLIDFLCRPDNLLTGKLISAKWDDWKKFTAKDIELLNNNSEYTLRRIDNQFFKEIKKS